MRYIHSNISLSELVADSLSAQRREGTMIRGVFMSMALVLVLAAPAARADTVNVLYAGSLVNLMEHGVGPAFDKATGNSFQGFAGGSNALANQIKGRLRRGDVFVSASPGVNRSLMGAADGNWVEWYVTFARSPLVIGYNPHSRFAADLRSKSWYQVLQEPGIRIGRTDPKLDPKGALTVQLLHHAEQIYDAPGLEQKVLGRDDNSDQVLPEETLVGRLQSGQIDVGFFYSTETSDLKIPYVSLPSKVALSAVYTATVLNAGSDPKGGASFVAFLLGSRGQAILREHGLTVVLPTVAGNASRMPASIRSEITAYK
jgi:molybdate/tungstate transport system substrate-binding protein